MAKKKQTAAKKTKTKAAKTKNSSTSDISKEPIIGHGPRPTLKSSCETIQNEVNDYLDDACTSKVNELAKCNDCQIDHTPCAVINSPFDAALINTGYDGAGGFIPSGSGTDLCWEAGLGDATGPGSVTTWIPAFVFKDNAWIASPFNNANWISVFSDSNHSGDIDVYFRIRFSLNSSFNPSQFFLDMSFYADNSVWEIYVCDVPQSTYHPGLLPQNSADPYNHVGFRPITAGVQIKLANDWKTCENEIIVHIKSGGPKIGFLAQNATNCYEATLPELAPEIKITWGDSDCDCIETNDLEVVCISVCNVYSNVIFKGLKIGRIRIVDAAGNPVPNLPDGTPSVQILPIGPHCFGDIGPCIDDGAPNSNCVSREFVIRTRGAKDGNYKLILEGICYEVCHNYELEECFELSLCKD